MSGRAVPLWIGGFGLVIGLTPAPVTTRYKIETKVETIIDLSAMGQGTQTQNVTQSAWISVALSDTAGGKTLHVVIDSLASDIPLPEAAAAMTQARGAWIHGRVDAGGRVTIAKSSADSNDFVAELKSTMSAFFPRTKAGAKAGDSWVDTTTNDTKTSSRAVRSTTVTTYTVGGAEAVGGVAATRIETRFASTTAGTVQNPMAGAMEMESADSGTGKHYLGADGRYLGGVSHAEGKATIKSAMMPEPVPLKIARTSTVTIVK